MKTYLANKPKLRQWLWFLGLYTASAIAVGGSVSFFHFLMHRL